MSTSVTSFNIIRLCLSTIMITSCMTQSCEWTVGSNTLDLSCLAGQVLTTGEINQNGDIIVDYSFSICTNSQKCEDQTVMAAQFPKNLPGRCFSVGSFDPSIQPIYQDISGGHWEFTYLGDKQDCPQPGREWIPTFICDTTTTYTIGVVTQSSTCDYSVPIRTKYACTDHHYECSEDGAGSSEGLSTGWMVIIIFVSVFCLYCIVGYIYMAKRVNTERGFSDFSNNIPNKSSWVKFCFLVIAGCTVTKDYMIGLLNKNKDDDGSRGGEESIASLSADGYQLELE